MKDIPILFCGSMIRALLADRKTNTRRMSERWMKVKAGDRLWVRETWRPHSWEDGGPVAIEYADGSLRVEGGPDTSTYDSWLDRICERSSMECERAGLIPDSAGNYSWYNGKSPLKWRPSIHMPRWASRITLEATEDARREPLADISEADAKAEGADLYVPGHGTVSPSEISFDPGYLMYGNYRDGFFDLWDSLHAKDAPVSSNPVPVRLAFRVLP